MTHVKSRWLSPNKNITHLQLRLKIMQKTPNPWKMEEQPFWPEIVQFHLIKH